jgi:hypothetical protein
VERLKKESQKVPVFNYKIGLKLQAKKPKASSENPEQGKNS